MSKHKVIDLIKQVKSLTTRDDLIAISNAAHTRLDYVNRCRAQDFTRGDRVSFTSSRSGRTMKGTVKKVNIKYVIVDIDGTSMSYRVPGSYLNLVA